MASSIYSTTCAFSSSSLTVKKLTIKMVNTVLLVNHVNYPCQRTIHPLLAFLVPVLQSCVILSIARPKNKMSHLKGKTGYGTYSSQLMILPGNYMTLRTSEGQFSNPAPITNILDLYSSVRTGMINLFN